MASLAWYVVMARIFRVLWVFEGREDGCLCRTVYEVDLGCTLSFFQGY